MATICLYWGIALYYPLNSKTYTKNKSCANNHFLFCDETLYEKGAFLVKSDVKYYISVNFSFFMSENFSEKEISYGEVRWTRVWTSIWIR